MHRVDRERELDINTDLSSRSRSLYDTIVWNDKGIRYPYFLRSVSQF